MKKTIDTLESKAGWSGLDPSYFTENQHEQYIAGGNAKSLQIQFDKNAPSRTAVKLLNAPIDVSDCETLIVSMWSAGKGRSGLYRKPADFAYKIEIDPGKVFYVPIYSIFTEVEIGLEDVDQISMISITALHQDSDTIIISEMVAEKEEVILDINLAVQEALAEIIDEQLDSKYYVGMMNGTVGDTGIEIENAEWLSRYGVVQIGDELHQVGDNEGISFQFTENFDGGSLLSTYMNTAVYLHFPVYFGHGQAEIYLPGITVWGIAPEPIYVTGKVDTLSDTWDQAGTSKQRAEGQHYEMTVALTCQARQQELLEKMAHVCRLLCGREILWVNGRRHDIDFDRQPTEMDLDGSGIDYIPQIVYKLKVGFQENLSSRKAVPETTSIVSEVELL